MSVQTTLPHATPLHRDADEAQEVWPTTISLAPLRADIRRRWRLVALFAVLGGIAGLLASTMLTSGGTATTTVFLAREGFEEPGNALQTDIGLLTTRAVAEQVITEEGLEVEPEEFMASYSVGTPSTQLLSISVSAEDPASALSQTQSLAEAFLAFRADLLTQQVDAANQGKLNEVDQLATQLAQVTASLDNLTGSEDPDARAEIDDLLGERGELTTRIAQLREAIQSEQVQLAAIIESSQVIDPPTLEPSFGMRTTVLAGVSGVIGGLALAVAAIVGQALLTDRPRRRSAIATDLTTPVLLSVGNVAGRRRSAREARDQATTRLTNLIGDRRGHASAARFALLSVSCEGVTSTVAAALARSLAGSGIEVTVIDLTQSGRLWRSLTDKPLTSEEWAQRLTREHPAADGIEVVRPASVPTIAQRPASLGDEWGGHDAFGMTVATGEHVTLVVGEATPAVGADHVATWADTAVLVLKAGAATHDRLSSSASVVRTAGMVLLGAVLTGSHRSDESLGEPHESLLSPQRPLHGKALRER